ncbi:amidase [Paracoccus sp. JM45]|uniref:amidase n=1 Tax=Paracoccus sp. JM45 TaxID=2283626 RepID=UPI000E6B8CF7|nr:amidase [Paracoccus sp. JM45]RJE78674.1 amidase [Paracoccus sp. JM45]
MTIAGILEDLDAGRASAVGLVRQAIARVSAAGTASPFATVEFDHALEQATVVDKARATGRPVGPLAGVPLAHKDMFERSGSRIGRGAHPLAAYVARNTATVLDRLDCAGALDLGRLQMSEFAMGPTGSNHHHGSPPNPVVPGAITGGSSSGSGVAVGMGIVPAALGSDTGGSIRIPAACNGVVGFKPTHGLVPVSHIMPLSWTQDCVGPLAASVDCARRVLSVLTMGTTRGTSQTSASLRIGFDTSDFAQDISAKMSGAMVEARQQLVVDGHKDHDIDLGWLASLNEPANVIAMAEAGTVHADRLRHACDTYGDQVRLRLTQAAAISAQAYLRARQIRDIARERMAQIFQNVDVLALPMLPDIPPQITALDALEAESLSRMITAMTRFARPASVMGLPAISLPIVWTGHGPLSLQLIGAPYSEDMLADLAASLESAFSRNPQPA